MKALAKRLWNEPALFLAALNAAVQAVVQTAVVTPGSTASWLVLGLGVLAQTLGTRQAVAGPETVKRLQAAATPPAAVTTATPTPPA